VVTLAAEKNKLTNHIKFMTCDPLLPSPSSQSSQLSSRSKNDDFSFQSIPIIKTHKTIHKDQLGRDEVRNEMKDLISFQPKNQPPLK